MRLKGGFTNYGPDIGILMLDTIFHRIPGPDSCQVLYRREGVRHLPYELTG